MQQISARDLLRFEQKQLRYLPEAPSVNHALSIEALEIEHLGLARRLAEFVLAASDENDMKNHLAVLRELRGHLLALK